MHPWKRRGGIPLGKALATELNPAAMEQDHYGAFFLPDGDVTPDGKFFLVVNPPPDAPGPIAIVANWDVG
jgi:hypothetical protein